MKYKLLLVSLIAFMMLLACGDDLKFGPDKDYYSDQKDDDDPDDDDPPTVYPDNNIIVSNAVYEAGTDNHIYFRIPALTVTKKGTILAFCEARNTEADFYSGNESKFPVVPVGSSKDLGNIDLVLKRSLDGGATWSNMIVIIDDKNNTCGNPSPVVVEETGRIYLFWCWQRYPSSLSSNLFSSISDGHTRRVLYCYSDDDGLTWSSHYDVTSQLKKSDWSWYATGPCHAIQKKVAPNKGRIIIPANHRDNNNTDNYSHAIYSDDNGKTWLLGGRTALGGNESCITELADGSILTNMRQVSGDFRAYSVSINGGITWGSFIVNSDLIDPGCQGAIVNYPINKSVSNTLLLSNTHHSTARSNLCISKSTNGGASWVTSLVVWAGRAAYSDIIVLNDGSVCVLYENGYGKYGAANPNEQISFYRIPPSLIKSKLGL
jgi:sialidase-1